ncbi:MAG: hypothetical protein JWQ06_1329 [Mucilaginibacter sp.]|nr:hypothetical protein [Mucilaginibacter sp.]
MDNKQNIGSPDRDRVNIHENYEVEYWAKKLGVTPEQLRQAVSVVGTSSVDVEKYLKN